MRTRIALAAAMAVSFTIITLQPTAVVVHRAGATPAGARAVAYDQPLAPPVTDTAPAVAPPPVGAWDWLARTAAAAEPPPPPTDATTTATADWQCIRVHESGDQYNSPAAPSGAYGIVQVTWHSNGFNGWPYQAAPAFQDALALKLYHEYGWGPWSSRSACGL